MLSGVIWDKGTMRRADRLFDIIEFLRRARKVVTAAELAAALEVSLRTIYRDMAALQAARVPVEGEAGIGYMLRPGYDLPPLMFTAEEVEALILGARIVSTWGDGDLSKAADQVVGKIHHVLPDDLKNMIESWHLAAPPSAAQARISIDLSALRRAIRDCHWIGFSYVDEHGRATTRRVRPLILAFYGPVWLVSSWCETRQDFRSFRLDRMSDMALSEDHFPLEAGRTREDFFCSDMGRTDGFV